MSTSDCARCHDPEYARPLDTHGWCARCRAEVIRGASRWAWGATAAAAGLYVLLSWAIRFPVATLISLWLAIGVLFCFAAYKITRRVAFAVIEQHQAAPVNRPAR